MESADNIVLRMNEMLDADHFDRKEFDFLLNQIMKIHNTKVICLDFKYFSEKLLRKVKREKIKSINVQDFEKASKQRELEKECQAYIEIKTDYRIDRSQFYLDQSYLFYFHLGTAKNDGRIRTFLKK